MTKAEIQEQVMRLPAEQRLDLAEAIWSSLDDPDGLPLPGWQRELLDERIAAAEHDPETEIPWSDVKTRALESL